MQLSSLRKIGLFTPASKISSLKIENKWQPLICWGMEIYQSYFYWKWFLKKLYKCYRLIQTGKYKDWKYTEVNLIWKFFFSYTFCLAFCNFLKIINKLGQSDYIPHLICSRKPHIWRKCVFWVWRHKVKLTVVSYSFECYFLKRTVEEENDMYMKFGTTCFSFFLNCCFILWWC